MEHQLRGFQSLKFNEVEVRDNIVKYEYDRLNDY